MPAHKKLIPTIKLTLAFPEPEHQAMTNYLYDPSAKKVPKGSYSAFLSKLVREYLKTL
jgi:hypothetical protein